MNHTQETLPIQSCLSLAQPLSRKRKRSATKTVRFDIEHTVIVDTWSALDYDRGCSSFRPSATIQYKLNPAFNLTPLSLEIPSSPCDSEASSPDVEAPPPHTLNKKKKPRLTVNTDMCPGGPLFFTKLSTNHVKHGIQDDEEGYLVPMTTVTPSSTIAFFSY